MLTRRTLTALVGLALALTLSGCRQDMHDQPKYEPLETSRFFADGQASRPWIEGTIARGLLRDQSVYFTALTAEGELTAELPIPVDRRALENGHDSFNTFCSPCHDYLGTGLGMIVQRGFKRPTSFHDPRLRDAPVGYFFDVMSNGFGDMSSYAAQLEPQERWEIAAYIRVLQLSQHVRLADLTAEDRAHLPATAGAEPADPATGGSPDHTATAETGE